jgi:DNA polymerase III delta prime subunit
MKNLLLSERWRPKTLEDTILLPRIRKLFENGIQQNVIFYGNFGTGKTTLARILIGKYSKNKPYLELNSSFYTSIETLRNKIDDFCSKVYMGLDLVDDLPTDSIKYVFLDEFDRTSIQYQDALKAYIEEFSRKNVRFIFTTNHINKVSAGIRSRLVEVNFDCQNSEEEKYLKREIYIRISNQICPIENFTITKENLVKIINKKFPDFRSILIELDQYRLTGQSTETTNSSNIKIKQELYSIIYDRSKNFEDIYTFLMENFGPEKIDLLLELFGKPFIEYSLKEKRENIDKLFYLSYIVCEYQKLLETNTDPVILGMTVLGKIRDIFLGKDI